MASKLLFLDSEAERVRELEMVDRPAKRADSQSLCEDSRRLLDAFGEAVQELLMLHEQQFLAILSGDSDCSRFDLLIHMANERKQQAKYAYMHHVETHRCSS